MDHAEAADTLEAVLAEENSALERHDPVTATALLDRKLAAVEALSIDHVSFEQGYRLRLLADENRRLLQQAIDIQSRIIGMVVRAAQGTPDHLRYGAEGRALAGLRSHAVVRQA